MHAAFTFSKHLPSLTSFSLSRILVFVEKWSNPGRKILFLKTTPEMGKFRNYLCPSVFVWRVYMEGPKIFISEVQWRILSTGKVFNCYSCLKCRARGGGKGFHGCFIFTIYGGLGGKFWGVFPSSAQEIPGTLPQDSWQTSQQFNTKTQAGYNAAQILQYQG